jgi:hypothetical protein
MVDENMFAIKNGVLSFHKDIIFCLIQKMIWKDEDKIRNVFF